MSASRTLVTWMALVGLCFGAAQAQAADDRRGEKLYRLCAQCHGADGEGSKLALAPAIAGLPQWYLEAQLQNFRSGVRGTHPEDVAGMRMYPMSQTLRAEGDIPAVAAYVASLAPVHPAPTLSGGDPGRGAQLYQPCTACHGADGAGNQALGSPTLRHASDWYLLSSLQKFKTGVRGNYPNAAIMRGMAAMLTDEQAMKDVIAYIQTLSNQTAANAPN